jgi:hypothetical protein
MKESSLIQMTCNPVTIDAQGEGEEGGTSCTLSKDFEKLDHKNAIKIKHKNRGPPPGFSHFPKCPPQKEFENFCASTYACNKFRLKKHLLSLSVESTN